MPSPWRRPRSLKRARARALSNSLSNSLSLSHTHTHTSVYISVNHPILQCPQEWHTEGNKIGSVAFVEEDVGSGESLSGTSVTN
jgi:hypothetical protein